MRDTRRLTIKISAYRSNFLFDVGTFTFVDPFSETFFCFFSPPSVGVVAGVISSGIERSVEAAAETAFFDFVNSGRRPFLGMARRLGSGGLKSGAGGGGRGLGRLG